MSGGRWGYLDDEIAKYGRRAQAGADLLAQIEHEMDWGICCDTCYECAKRRVIAALECFFDTGTGGAEAALKILKDHRDTHLMCENHFKINAPDMVEAWEPVKDVPVESSITEDEFDYHMRRWIDVKLNPSLG